MSAASIIGLSYKGRYRPRRRRRGKEKRGEKKRERRIVSWRCRKICGIDGNAGEEKRELKESGEIGVIRDESRYELADRMAGDGSPPELILAISILHPFA